MLPDQIRARFRTANERDAEACQQVQSREDWERFRDERIAALRDSLGAFPPAAGELDLHVTGTIPGDRFHIENIVFQSRPGLVVAANLYVPDPPRASMPGILICHSHHQPKHQPELQDMGMNWARMGSVVLVPEQLGHGERRQQPHGGREDYHNRYITGMQLHLVGESLMGWMVWDLVRCLDLLLSRPGVDPERIIAIGAVAGGGDPVAVLAALDQRVKCAVPFNFGEPEPMHRGRQEPAAPRELTFAGNGSWESTRNLRLNARDGFLPWVIVAATAPRHLIYAHEFEWRPDTDPVWPRLQRVFGFHDATDRLAHTSGWGEVTKRPPAASHCTNVGPPHREAIYPLLERWFGIPPPDPERQQRLDPAELRCITPRIEMQLRPRTLHEVAAQLGAQRLASAREGLDRLSSQAPREKLRQGWARLLGDVEPSGWTETDESRDDTPLPSPHTAERLVLETEPGIVVPVLILMPPAAPQPPPVVIAVAHHGKEELLRERAGEIGRLLEGGIAVCLPDVRGTGATSAADSHAWQDEWRTGSIWASASALMLGDTLLGGRLRDIRSVLRYLRARRDLDGRRVGLWGESLAPANPLEFVDPPLRTDDPPHLAEPLGQLLAMLCALFEDDIRAVATRGGIVGFASCLDSPTCYIPHDVHIPGVLRVGDVADLAVALAPLPLRFEALVDGRNRTVGREHLDTWFASARRAYRDSPGDLVLSAAARDDLAEWMASCLRP
jgi:dienelactone hydrolase